MCKLVQTNRVSDWCNPKKLIPSGNLLHSELENHHFEWVNQLFLWQFSIVMLVYQRVMIPKNNIFSNNHQETTVENRSYLVGGLEHGFYFPYYMGCHPSH